MQSKLGVKDFWEIIDAKLWLTNGFVLFARPPKATVWVLVGPQRPGPKSSEWANFLYKTRLCLFNLKCQIDFSKILNLQSNLIDLKDILVRYSWKKWKSGKCFRFSTRGLRIFEGWKLYQIVIKSWLQNWVFYSCLLHFLGRIRENFRN